MTGNSRHRQDHTPHTKTPPGWRLDAEFWLGVSYVYGSVGSDILITVAILAHIGCCEKVMILTYERKQHLAFPTRSGKLVFDYSSRE